MRTPAEWAEEFTRRTRAGWSTDSQVELAKLLQEATAELQAECRRLGEGLVRARQALTDRTADLAAWEDAARLLVAAGKDSPDRLYTLLAELAEYGPRGPAGLGLARVPGAHHLGEGEG